MMNKYSKVNHTSKHKPRGNTGDRTLHWARRMCNGVGGGVGKVRGGNVWAQVYPSKKALCHMII